MYADDFNFSTAQKTIAECQHILQENIRIIDEWCTQNRLLINVNKTKCMIICSEQRHHQMDNTSFDLVLNRNVLETVSYMKILGIKYRLFTMTKSG